MTTKITRYNLIKNRNIQVTQRRQAFEKPSKVRQTVQSRPLLRQGFKDVRYLRLITTIHGQHHRPRRRWILLYRRRQVQNGNVHLGLDESIDKRPTHATAAPYHCHIGP